MLAEAGVLAGQDERVGVVEVGVLLVEDAVAEADKLALLERARRDDAIAMDLE